MHILKTISYSLKILILATIFLESTALADAIKVSNKLSLIKLSKHVYMHTSDNNNGLIVLSNNEAIIVSTPATNFETQNLIDWIKNDLKHSIIGVVVDRWHYDAMGGLESVHKNNIRSYSHNLTRRIAKEKMLPVPEIGFNDKHDIVVGTKLVTLEHLGEAHTSDGIVVWVPDEKILFGGNSVRDLNGWVGNISDANLQEWSRTIKRVKANYGSAQYVVPGHGKFGTAELLDYTINLYEPFSNWKSKASDVITVPNMNGKHLVIRSAEIDSKNSQKRMLRNATLFVQDKTKVIEVNAPSIEIKKSSERIFSKTGSLKIYDKVADKLTLRVSASYQQLYIVPVDEYVGLGIVMRTATPLESDVATASNKTPPEKI